MLEGKINKISKGRVPKKYKNVVFDHTPLPPPPLKHIYGPLIALFLKLFFLQEMEHNIKNDFLLKKKSTLLKS